MLLPFALAVGLLARRVVPRRGLAWAVVGVNEAWVVASLVPLVGPWVAPSALGVAFVLAQAVVMVMWTPPTTLLWAREGRLDRRLRGWRACGGAA